MKLVKNDESFIELSSEDMNLLSSSIEQ